MKSRHPDSIVRDIAIVLFSILIAVMLVRSGILHDMLASVKGFQYLGSFIAGIFFTSVFTTAPAIAALAEITQTSSLVTTALIGAVGALIGDVLIFRFVRDRLSDHLLEVFQHSSPGRRIKALLRKKVFRGLTFLVGGLIIASPLPDELGISLLGFSKVKTSSFVALSFIFNFVGIILIGLVARSI